ncbi:DMT family protein, partial [Rhizobium ruizarguesonis]
MPFSPAAVWPIVMLFASNLFMTFAWYGHLPNNSSAIFLALIVRWGIA